ncbi:hypothetical protein CPB84DRAFT_1793833, partial [Gymnopilus junonius]
MPPTNNYFGEPMPSYPPQAHPSLEQNNAINDQPAPSRAMSLHAPQQNNSKQPAARLRGGCIPCPHDRSIVMQLASSDRPGKKTRKLDDSTHVALRSNRCSTPSIGHTQRTIPRTRMPPDVSVPALHKSLGCSFSSTCASTSELHQKRRNETELNKRKNNFQSCY